MYVKIGFVSIVCILVYLTYISPMVSSIKTMTKDDILNKNMAVISVCERFDKRSYSKALNKLKAFMIAYSKSYGYDTDTIQKLKYYKTRTMHYLYRIPLMIPNDANATYELENAIQHIDTQLDNYIVEAGDRKMEYVFS